MEIVSYVYFFAPEAQELLNGFVIGDAVVAVPLQLLHQVGEAEGEVVEVLA